MKFAVAAAILLAAPLAAAAPAKSTTGKAAPAKAAPAKAKTAAAATAAPAKRTTPIVETPRLRHETIGIGPGYGSIEAGRAELSRKDDDTAIARSLTATSAQPASPSGPFAAVETTVLHKRPKATGRIRVSFDVDRRGRIQRAMVFGFDRGLDKAIEAKLKASVLGLEYAGQHVDTVLAFQRGKLLRR